MTREPIRLLHVITGLRLGGTETVLLRLLSHIDRARFSLEVVSLTSGGPVAQMLIDMGVNVRTLNMRRGMPDPRAIFMLKRWIQELRPQIMQTWLYHADLLGGLAALSSNRAPVIWNLRQGDLSWQGNKMVTLATAATCAALSRSIPSRIVCCSNTARKVHERLGYAAHKMEVIPNGFDLDRFRPDPVARRSFRSELGVSQHALLVGLVARFHPQKDHRNFIQAAKRVMGREEVHFVLCGDEVSPANVDLVRMLTAAGIRDRCHLLGPRADVSRVLAALDVAVSSSFGEGFPNVVGEALACGVPCAVTDVGNCASMVGEAGIVVPPRNSLALADAINRLLALSPCERRQLGEVGRKQVAASFSLTAAVKRYEQLYEQVLAERAVNPGNSFVSAKEIPVIK